MSIADLEIEIWDKDYKRKYFPSHMVQSCEWSLIEKGYYGDCTITVLDDFTEPLGLVSTDRVEITLAGVRRYIGFVGMPDHRLEDTEVLEINAYGPAEQLNSILIDCKHVFPGGLDLADIFQELVNKHINPEMYRRTGLDIIPSSHLIGFSVDTLDLSEKTARESLDILCELSGETAVWSAKLGSAGAMTLDFRPKPTVAKYNLSIGKNVKSYSYPPDYTSIINRVYLTGGEHRFPNLANNPSFEDPIVGEEVNGNLIANGGFEVGDFYWAFVNASRSTDNVKSGKNCLKMEQSGSSAIQYNCPVIAGKTYNLYVYMRNPNACSYHFEIQPDGGNSLIRFPSSGSYSDGAQADPSYILYQPVGFTAPSDATKVSVKIVADSASTDFTIDDVSLFCETDSCQTGWEVIPPKNAGSASISVQWDYLGEAHHKNYSPLIITTTQIGDPVRIIQRYDNAISAEEGTRYDASAWVWSNAAGTVYCGVFALLSDGSYTVEVGVGIGVLANTWTEVPSGLSGGFKVEPGTISVEKLLFFWDLQSTVAGESSWMIDQVYIREYTTSICPYTSGQNYEFILSTEDDFIQDDTSIPDGVLASVTDYGYRDASESVDTIDSQEKAEQWAKGYFGINAQPVVAHSVEIADCTDIIAPDGLLRLVGADHIAPAFPAKITYKIDGNNQLNISADLNTERPSFQLLLQRVLNQAKSQH